MEKNQNHIASSVMDDINIKRIRTIAFIIGILMIALLCRAFYIQILSHDNLSEGAVAQYEVPVEGMDTRGAILDRNYMPLTGGKSQYYYFIKKSIVQWNENEETFGLDYNFDETAEPNKNAEFSHMIKDLDARQIARSDSKYYVFRTENFDSEINQKLKKDYKAYVFESEARYSDEQLACHLIGYINQSQKVGVSGLELQYEDLLKSDNSKLTLWADSVGSILLGKEPVVVSSMMQGNALVTTIDRRLQAVSERALQHHGAKGAAIVMNAENGEILSWSSLPTFNPNNIGEYLSDESDCLINKVSQGAYAPGSVFKIVTAAAALEAGISETTEYECLGEVTVEGVTLGCSTAPEGGHGMIDMNTAMAHSCNCYFAQLGQAVGVDAIVMQAEVMGFGTSTQSIDEEAKGNLPSVENIGPWDTSNISIGQGQLLATPLQIAKMTAIIANGGRDVKPCVVESETEVDDTKNDNQVISAETAEKIQKMLSLVMTEGTGKVDADWGLSVYGKTGTAELGEINNCWFTGYCEIQIPREDSKVEQRNGEEEQGLGPAHTKKYVISVLVEDGVSGSSSALPVFREIVEYLSLSEDGKLKS